MGLQHSGDYCLLNAHDPDSEEGTNSGKKDLFSALFPHHFISGFNSLSDDAASSFGSKARISQDI